MRFWRFLGRASFRTLSPLDNCRDTVILHFSYEDRIVLTAARTLADERVEAETF